MKKYLLSCASTFICVSNFAVAATSPVLVKHTVESYGSGNVRTTDCAVSVDGVVITRDFAGLTSTEEKTLKLSGDINSKIDDVVATKAEPQKVSPADFSYSMVAYKTSAGGSRDVAVLSSFDGLKGEEVYNTSVGAGVLRNVLAGICDK